VSECYRSSSQINTLQHAGTHCNTLQHVACLVLRPLSTLQHTTTHCNALQHTATHCNIVFSDKTTTTQTSHTASRTIFAASKKNPSLKTRPVPSFKCLVCHRRHRSTLQHTAAHCNTAHLTTAHCNTLLRCVPVSHRRHYSKL